LTSCASKGDLDLVQRDSEELKSRFLTMEKELSTIRTESKDNAEQAKKGLLQELDSVKGDFSQIRKTAADLQANLDASKGDMQALAGRIDDVAVAAKKPADDVNIIKDDLERRYSSLDERLTALEKTVRELQTKGSPAAKEAPLTPEALYQKGLDAQRAGDPVKGRELLLRFLQQNPKNELAANAQYWVGETYYNEKNYEQAILAFQDVIKHYPGKEMIPAAMLKQGMAFADLGDAKSARFVYGKLKEDFPKTEEAKQAIEKLKLLK
jgi:tol-pal system protein YbgF